MAEETVVNQTPPVVPGVEVEPVVAPPVAAEEPFFDVNKVPDGLKESFKEMQAAWTNKCKEAAAVKDDASNYKKLMEYDAVRAAVQAEIQKTEDEKNNALKKEQDEDALLEEPVRKMKAKVVEHDAFIAEQHLKAEIEKVNSYAKDTENYPGFNELRPEMIKLSEENPKLNYEQLYRLAYKIDAKEIKKKAVEEYTAALEAGTATSPGNYSATKTTEPKSYKGREGTRQALEDTIAMLNSKK